MVLRRKEKRGERVREPLNRLDFPMWINTNRGFDRVERSSSHECQCHLKQRCILCVCKARLLNSYGRKSRKAYYDEMRQSQYQCGKVHESI